MCSSPTGSKEHHPCGCCSHSLAVLESAALPDWEEDVPVVKKTRGSSGTLPFRSREENNGIRARKATSQKPHSQLSPRLGSTSPSPLRNMRYGFKTNNEKERQPPQKLSHPRRSISAAAARPDSESLYSLLPQATYNSDQHSLELRYTKGS